MSHWYVKINLCNFATPAVNKQKAGDFSASRGENETGVLLKAARTQGPLTRGRF